jgi:hypothetical protein
MTKLWWVLWRREAKRARALRTTLYLECLEERMVMTNSPKDHREGACREPGGEAVRN